MTATQTLPEPHPSKRRARRLLVPLAIALAAVLAFAAVLPGGKYVFDDHVLIEKNFDLVRPNIWWAAFSRDYYATSEAPGVSGYYRPVAVLVNAIDVHVWHARPKGLHFTNLVLHAAASVALAAALQVFGAPAAVAWMTAMLFAVHPVHAESVAFISGRVDLLAALGIFVVLALTASRRRFATLGIGLAALFAFLSKEAAIVLPLLVLMAWMARFDAVQATGGQPADPAAARGAPTGVLLVTAIGAAALVALLMRYAALGAWLPSSAGAPRSGSPLLLPFETLGFGIASLYAPRARLSLEPDPSRLPAVWLGAGLLMAAILWIGAWRLDREARPLLRRALIAGAIALLPVLNFLRQETLLSERYMYLASGFWLVPAGVLLVAGWRRAGGLRPLVAGAAAVILLLLGGISAWRARAWRDDLLLWRIAVREEPQRAAFWDRLGLTLTERHQFEGAEQALRRAVELDPKYFNARLNLGVMLQTGGRPYEAIPVYREALGLEPRHVNAHLNLGMALAEMGDTPGAYEQFKIAVQIKPDHPEALRLLGGTALQLGRLQEARQALEAARRLYPENPNIIAAFRILEQAEHQRATRGTPSPPPPSPSPQPAPPPPSH